MLIIVRTVGGGVEDGDQEVGEAVVVGVAHTQREWRLRQRESAGGGRSARSGGGREAVALRQRQDQVTR